MRIFLFIMAIILALFGFSVLLTARSAVHEIEAFVVFLIAAVLFTGAGVIDAVQALRKELTKQGG